VNDIVRFEHKPLTAADLRGQVNLVQEVMKAVMKQGVHYGIIPGCDKPSLWKPGAEVLCATFRIAPSFRIEDLSREGAARYRITCVGTHQLSGVVLGEGLGECTSHESKYKWRKAYQTEFNHTPENQRRIRHGWDTRKRQEYEILQVRIEPADVLNTILKMAAKRALIAMTLNVTAASDIFTQDIEDLSDEVRHVITGDDPGAQQGGDEPKVEQPRATQAKAATKDAPADDERAARNAQPMAEGQWRIIKAKMAQRKLTDEQLVAKFGPKEAITFGQFAAIQGWIDGGAQ